MLREVADALYRIALRLAEMVGLLAVLGIKIDQTAVEDSPYLLQRRINDIRDATVLNAASNANLLTHLHSIIALLGDGVPGVLEAIAALPAGSDLVNPTPFDASSVWNVLDPNSANPGKVYGDEIWELYSAALTKNQGEGLRMRAAPFFVAFATWSDRDVAADISTTPEPDWADIQAADTRLSWLQRTEGYLNWTEDAYSGSPVGVKGTAASDLYWQLALTEAEFNALKGSTSGAAAPVWPGLALVTLGTPVAITGGQTITEPMDGVVVAITAVDPKQLYFTYDDILAYRHIGALAFVSDNGDVEQFQPLGFTSAIYVPKTMAQAAAVKVMTPGGTVGTVTPWIRT